MTRLPKIQFKILTLRNLLLLIVLLLLANLVVWLVRPSGKQSPVLSMPSILTKTAQSTQNSELETPDSINYPLPSTEIMNLLNQNGVYILSMADSDYFHLFAYHPLHLPLTRLTSGAWDDCYPALSPDGKKLAFASHRDGFWDIYILTLADNSISRLTDTPTYDSQPTWSPDGQWIAYESLVGNNLDIILQSVNNPDQPVLQLTDNPAADTSPAWSPSGRQIAFVSTRSGSEDIWLASLDEADNRFSNLTQTPDQQESSPVWSPDGSKLAWINFDGTATEIWTDDFEGLPKKIGEGALAVWNPDGNQLGAVLQAPNQTYITTYSASSFQITLPASPMWGDIKGLLWAKGSLPEYVTNPENKFSLAEPLALWQVDIDASPVPPFGRAALIPLENIEAPYPLLHDQVDEAFQALNQATSRAAGWDFLASLENAYTPLTQPVLPGLLQDWQTTGRAIAVNPVSLYAGWMAVSREDYYGSTYWRVYIKARHQDGSQGAPIAHPVWDFTARFSGDTVGYEMGGKYQAAPEGYWIDFTSIAQRYGWSRLPSEGSWRTYFAGTHFNQFVLTNNLTWYEAMIQLYPPEALEISGFAPYISTTPQP